MSDEKIPDVETLIPHRCEMKLIDKILSLDDESRSLRAGTTVLDKWPLCDHGAVDSILCVELIAQAVGCRHGWEQHQAQSERPAVGFLVGIKSARFQVPRIPVGRELEIEVTYQYGIKEYAAYSGAVLYDGDVLCEAVVQVLSPTGDELKEALSDRPQPIG